jgi:hypothetical protein
LGSSLIDSPCLSTGPFERRTRRQSAEVQLELKTIVERLLEQEPGAALCDACLAFAAAASLLETRGVIEALVRVGQHSSAVWISARAAAATRW